MIPNRILNVNRQVQLCPAALRDLRMLLPRRDSRAVVVRHAMKLRSWRRGAICALDLDVAPIPQSEILELCVTDCFGFNCGLRLAFFEDILASPDGLVWIIGVRRFDEPLSEQMTETLSRRKRIIEERTSAYE
jgi:hypothetical protein